MVKADRIVAWRLAETVEMLWESGLKRDEEVAKRMNLIDSVKQATGDQQVLRVDIENYRKHRAAATEERLAKSLKYSPQGQELIERAQETIGRLVEAVTPVEALLPRATRLLAHLMDRNEAAMDAVAGGADPADHPIAIPGQDIKALRDLFGIVRDVVGDVKGDEKITQLLRAGEVNLTQNQGISFEEMWDKIIGMAPYLECPSCGFHSYTDTHMSAAFAKSRAKADVIDAED